MNTTTLQERFTSARALGKRAKDAAESIGVSEGEALAAHAGSHAWPLKTMPLRANWLEILKALGECGPVLVWRSIVE